MFEYTRRAIASRFDHPVLGLMFLIAGLMAVSGLLLRVLITMGLSEWRIGAGFLAVFGTFFALIGTIGYGVLFLARFISVARDSVGPAS